MSTLAPGRAGPTRRGRAVSAGERREALPTRLVCAGCGRRLPADGPLALRCPHALPGDDVDHVVARLLDPTRLTFPSGDEPNPFVRYRSLFHAYHAARALGWPDEAYVGLVERLDEAVAAVDEHGFRVTPLLPSPALAARLGFAADGAVLVKDETGNVSGSHKARHLMGTLLELEVEAARRATDRAPDALLGGHEEQPLAIASCGNAALAAAVLAKAAGRGLEVFVPPDADPAVMGRLRRLGALLVTCARRPGVLGDPTYHRLQQALERGALPFTCQGNQNGLAIEGGETLGYELVSQLTAAGQHLDRLFVQVGGGALASAVAQALAEARELGVLERLPRLHAVQTRGAYPLVRAYERVAAYLTQRLGPSPATPHALAEPTDLQERADRLQALLRAADAPRELAWIAHHRSAFMWPWETEPHSVAGGILDDETYDWWAVVRAMLASGGYPVVVDEPVLREANTLAVETTGIDVDPTGSAGLAGLIELRRQGLVEAHEAIGLLFTGVRRSGPTPHPHTTPGGPS